MTAISGAARNSGLYTCGGVKSSLNRNFRPSAAGCSRPKGPTREGPQRFCMWPTTLRSSQTVYSTAVSSRTRTIADLITDARMKIQIGNATPGFLSGSNNVSFKHKLQIAASRSQSAATSAGFTSWLSITDFKVREYRPNVPELNSPSLAGAIDSAGCAAPGPLLVNDVCSLLPARRFLREAS